MTELLKEYLPIVVFLGIAVAVAGLLTLASYVLARQKPDSEKLSAYECGFEAFSDSRGPWASSTSGRRGRWNGSDPVMATETATFTGNASPASLDSFLGQELKSR